MFVVVDPRTVTRSRATRRGKRRPVTPLASATTLYKIATRGADDYLRLSSEASARANELSAARQVVTADGVATSWESPHALRHWALEQEHANDCLRLMGVCMGIGQRANVRQYQHRCYVEARQENTTRDDTTAGKKLSADMTDALDVRDRDPADDPPPITALISSPLATRAASNAPGCRVRSRASRFASRIDQRRTTAATRQKRTSDTT